MVVKSLLGLLLRICRLLLFLLSVSAAKSASSKISMFNVRKYGAVAEGKRDNNKVFLQAWKEACQLKGKARLYIPKGKIHGNGTHGICWATFDFVTNGLIQRIRSINSKAFHINVFGCKKLKFKFLKIIAPDDSPYTDGIHIRHSNEVTVYDSYISTGDDYISVVPGSFNTYIFKVVCGPGHGISVGSLGKYPNEEDVVGLIVRNCTLKGTDNGLRVKIWAPSPPSIARNFTFEHIFMDNVLNPIIIDQNYCPSGSCSHQSPPQVHIRDLSFKDIRGTSGTKLVVDLSCSSRVPCRNVKLENIHLLYKGNSRFSTSSCSNVHGTSYGHQIPPSCIT
ncbi:hypothetical protein MKX01_009984 [Papaver californicum]|nr:hypothetical protein MKX01_009984 [Papaver californicum]